MPLGTLDCKLSRKGIAHDGEGKDTGGNNIGDGIALLTPRLEADFKDLLLPAPSLVEACSAIRAPAGNLPIKHYTNLRKEYENFQNQKIFHYLDGSQ